LIVIILFKGLIISYVLISLVFKLTVRTDF